MKNCKLTQLKGSVNNSEMRFFHDIKFYVGEVSSSKFFKPVSGKSITIRTYDGSSKIAKSQEDYDNDNFVSELVLTSGQSVFFKNPNTYFSIADKYNLDSIGSYSINDNFPMVLDLEDFKYYSGELYLKACILYGSLDNIFNITSTATGTWKSINFTGCTFIDDTDYNKIGLIKSLASTIRIATNGSNLKGSVEGLFTNYRKAHTDAVSGSITYSGHYSADTNVITFNGNKVVAGSYDKTFSWVPNSINTAYTDITDGTTTITVDEDGNKVVS